MRIAISIGLLLLSFNTFGQCRVIHVLVALCDNINQGIVPVPEAIGNGKDPGRNLYWGCGYGVKTFFKNQIEWKLITQVNNPEDGILERLVFQHNDSAVFLVADAYDGAMIQQTVIDFLRYSSGQSKKLLKLDSMEIAIGGNANLVCYIGHNGLMDFTLDEFPAKADSNRREVIILSCVSKTFFSEYVEKAGAYPLLWTTQLMCPEAYTLDAAVDSWIINDLPENSREKAANAYNQYQKCGIDAARNLLVTGF
jgi:hypothetical protein